LFTAPEEVLRGGVVKEVFRLGLLQEGNLVQPGSEKSFGHLMMAHPELWADKVGIFMHELEAGASSSEMSRTARDSKNASH
jgi:hypothetical protein